MWWVLRRRERVVDGAVWRGSGRVARVRVVGIDAEQVEDVDMRLASVALPADHGARKC
jgi:hypothetical protein